MVQLGILTKTENKVLNKKLNYQKLSQVESNYLSRSIRPKLQILRNSREEPINSILQKIQYNQKAISLEQKIKQLIVKSIKKVTAVVVYGSVIQTNYSSYNDIDVLIVVKKKSWNNEKEKYHLIKEIKEKSSFLGLNLDVQIIEKKEFYLEYPSSPDFIYQLSDHKIIYGKLSFPKNIRLSKLNLHMKLDWSNIEDTSPTGEEIYKAIRNAILVRLLVSKIINNQKLKEILTEQLGNYLLEKLKTNQESNLERKFALNYLRDLSKQIRREIGEALWEKIEL